MRALRRSKSFLAYNSVRREGYCGRVGFIKATRVYIFNCSIKFLAIERPTALITLVTQDDIHDGLAFTYSLTAVRQYQGKKPVSVPSDVVFTNSERAEIKSVSHWGMVDEALKHRIGSVNSY